MAGGAVGPGVIVDLSRLNTIGRIDRTARTVVAEPGVICNRINAAARLEGLRFPVDPSSAAFCTIGGMVSTNAAGARSLKFGATRPWVKSLDCVFADGSRGRIVRGEKPPNSPPVAEFLSRAKEIRAEWAKSSGDHSLVRKDSSGYALGRYFETEELVDLIVGSEGTLAIVVGVELALAPTAKSTSSLLAAFGSLENAAKGADAARAAGASACELLDKTFLDLAATAPESTAESRARAEKSAAILLIELETEDEASGEAAAAQLRVALESAGAISVEMALTAESERGVWDLRHAVSPILSRLKTAASMQFIEDGAVPPQNLPAYVSGVRKALADRSVEGVIFGHAGDAHVHVNPLVDVNAPDWRETVGGLLDDVVSLTARLGGTLCGEHGDGRLRTPLMSRVWSEGAIKAFADVKRCFDPAMMLNPGVKVPLAGQNAIGAIKYDPSLAPIPAAARKALDGIVERRGYSDFRLSLIDGIS
jgi:FAD/FMN-containing dehydrogenase